MRIAISGPDKQRKSKLMSDILHQWPSYTTPEKCYKDVIEDLMTGDQSNNITSEQIQRGILELMIDNMEKYDKDSNVLYNRGIAYKDILNNHLVIVLLY